MCTGTVLKKVAKTARVATATIRAVPHLPHRRCTGLSLACRGMHRDAAQSLTFRGLHRGVCDMHRDGRERETIHLDWENQRHVIPQPQPRQQHRCWDVLNPHSFPSMQTAVYTGRAVVRICRGGSELGRATLRTCMSLLHSIHSKRYLSEVGLGWHSEMAMGLGWHLDLRLK